MAYPTPIVEIGFDDGPYVLSPFWTDVTQYVRRMSIDRGRSDDWGDFNSTATVVLNNRARLFDPYYTAGPHYGKLLPRRQIRILGRAGATTYQLFRGFIDGWNPEWTDAGTDSTTTIQCFDALQLLAGENLPVDWADDYIQSLSPRHYWPLRNPIPYFNTSTVALNDEGSTPIPLSAAAISEQGPQLFTGTSASSVQGTGVFVTTPAPGAVGTATDLTVSMWLMPLGTSGFFSGGTFIIGGRTLNVVFGEATSGPASGDLDYFLVEYYVGATLYQWRSTIKFGTNEAHHVAFTVNSSTAVGTLYIDGINRTGTRTSLGTTASSTPEQYLFNDCAVQQVCVFTSILTQSQIQQIIQSSNASIEETTEDRFNRVIAKTPFPSGMTSVSTPTVNTVLDITYGGTSATSELRNVDSSEGGQLFVAKDGVVTLYAQNTIFTAPTSIQSQITYGDGGTDIGTEATLTADGDSMRNQAQIGISQGGTYSQTNTASVATYGTAIESMSTQIATLEEADNLASLITGFGGNIYPYLSPISVVLDPSADWGPTLDLELMERVTVKLKPPTGNVITHPMLVQRIQHEVTPNFWQTTIEGSARWAAVFILNQSTLGGTDLLG